jgi:hypothetical protein
MNWEEPPMKIHLNYFNHKFFQSGLLLVYFLFSGLLFSAYATNHYVDNTANGNNSGTSWADAWESLSDISWNTVAAGDIVYISGGTDSTVYNENLYFGSSHGTSTNQLTVTAGTDAGHNGRVIIGTQASNTGTVNFSTTNDYITLSHVKVKAIRADDGLAGGYGSYHFASNYHIGIRIEYCTLYAWDAKAIIFRGTKDCKGYHNTITTPTYSTSETDGYFIQGCSGTIIDGDSIIISNTYSNQHCDGIQLNQDTSTIVRNCYIEHTDNKSSNSQCIYGTEGFGDIVYYNNVINEGPASSNLMAVKQGTIGNYTSITIVGNTLTGNSSSVVSHGIWVTEYTGAPVIKNNLISYSNQVGTGIAITSPTTNVSYNLQHNTTATVGTNVITSDPLFTNVAAKDFTLQSESPAIDAGTYLGSPYNVDKRGITRSNPPDRGAYEYANGGGGGGNNPPDQPTNPNPADGAVNQPTSLTLTWDCTDPDGDPLTYDVYFGETNNPPLVSGSQTNTSYNPGQLNNNTTYYWKIVAEDNQGASTAGPQWNFTTLSDSNELVQLQIDSAYADAWYQNYTPPKAIDGITEEIDPESRWGGAIPMPDEIMFDLGQNEMVAQTRFSFFLWNSGRIYIYSVYSSMDGNSWSAITENDTSSSSEWSVLNFNPVECRYIKLVSISNNQSQWAGIYEAELWGENLIPVELESFSAEANKEGNVVLSWTTSTETNNSSFVIERRQENNQYTPIGTVQGKGTSTLPNSYTFTDNTVRAGTYIYRLKQIDFNGSVSYSKPVTVEVAVPTSFILSQNYPNPFNPATTISFSVPEESFVTLKVYDILGNEVKTLVYEKKSQGTYKVQFNAVNMTSGVYFYRIQAGSFVAVRKMILIK